MELVILNVKNEHYLEYFMDAKLVESKLVQAFVILCADPEDMQVLLSLENYDAILSIISTCYSSKLELEKIPFRITYFKFSEKCH